jgi:hypothetical protein
VLTSTTPAGAATPSPRRSGLPTPRGTCNFNQGADPFVGPDGALYIAYSNFNTTVSGNDNHFQVLLTKSTNGGQSFGAPVKVSDYFELPDCLAFQNADPFRACVPEKGTAQNSIFRASNYPAGAVNPRNPRQVVVTIGVLHQPRLERVQRLRARREQHDHRRPALHRCQDARGLQQQDHAGRLPQRRSVVRREHHRPAAAARGQHGPRQKRTDQWFQWAEFTPRGTLATDYYDRQYGSAEFTGNMGISVSTSMNLTSFKVSRATSASMPLPTQFPDGNGNSQFFGDYGGLTAVSGAHPLWSDTRNPDAFVCPGTAAPGVPPAVCTAAEPNGLIANDQQIYTRSMPAS